MTTVVAALDRIARQTSVATPSSWITATTKDQIEIRDDFLLETVDDIVDRLDLASPISQQTTLTGGAGTTNADGSETFGLPAEFKRVQRDQLALYDVDQDRPCIPITNTGQWTMLTDTGAAGAIKYYRIQGYDGNFTVEIYNAPGTGSEVKLAYISKNWMATSGGTFGSVLANLDDVLLLPNRVVEVGTVWRFRERRGLPYEDKYAEYEALIARLSNDSRGRRVVNFGGIDKDVRWQDLIPAFIPSS